MSEPFLGEIRIFAGNFAPRGWALCQGQLLPIAQNTALFSLLGTIYGGNGQTTFALPDLRGRVPVHVGTGPGLSPRTQGESAGAEQVTLTLAQVPSHTHALQATTAAATLGVPTNSLTGFTFGDAVTTLYATADGAVPMASGALGPSGTAGPHDNRMPYCAMNFIIAVEGIFPSRN